jgi:hypothetical protein
VTSTASTSAPPTTRQRRAVEERAAASFGREQLLARRIVDGRELGHAVDLQRERRAEDRQPVREIRRAVDRVEHPARTRRCDRRATHLFGEHLMIRKALRDQRAKHALDRHVDLGDEIDRPFLSIWKLPPNCAICRSPARTTASMAVVR